MLIFGWFYPEHMDPIKHNSVFSCIHSLRKVFQKFFKNTFWTIVPFLLKLSFFLADFSRHEILLEHMGPKILSPVPVSQHKTPKISGEERTDGRTDGHRNLNGSHTKALRAINLVEIRSWIRGFVNPISGIRESPDPDSHQWILFFICGSSSNVNPFRGSSGVFQRIPGHYRVANPDPHFIGFCRSSSANPY